MGGFQYSTALDINMEYYMIKILTHSKNMATIFIQLKKIQARSDTNGNVHFWGYILN